MITNITAEIRPVRPTLLPRQPFSFLGLEAENKSLFSWNVEIERKPNIILRNTENFSHLATISLCRLTSRLAWGSK